MEELLKQIKYCLYVVIALLVAVLIAIVVVNGDSKTYSNNSNNESTNNDTTNDGGNNSDDTNTEYDVSMFESIDATQFLSTINSENPTVVYLGRGTCSFCVKFLPVLQQAQANLGYTTKYIDIYGIDQTSDDYNTMVSKINEFTDTFNSKNSANYEAIYGYTPLVLVVQNSEIKDAWIGNGEYNKFVEFLNNNGIN